MYAVILAIGYFAAAYVGRLLSFQATYVVVFWPPSGVFAAALLCTPFRLWPPLILAAGLAKVGVDLVDGQPLLASLGFFTARCIEATSGAWLVNRILPQRPSGRVGFRELLAILGCSAVFAPALSGIVGATVTSLAFGNLPWPVAWVRWWAMDSLSVVAIGTFLVAACRYGHAALRTFRMGRVLEFLALFTLTCGQTVWVFGPNGNWGFKFTLLLPLFWAALRFRILGVSGTGLTMSLLGVYLSSRFHLGMLGEDEIAGHVQLTQLFFGSLLVPMQILAVSIQSSRQSRAALAASEERYRSIVEDQVELVCRFKPDGTFTFVNQGYCAFFGVRREEAVGAPWKPVAHPDDLPMIQERLALLDPENPVVNIENRVFDSRGELRWAQFSNRGFFDGQGRLTEVQSVGRDVTDRKQAEMELELSHAKFRGVFERSPVGLMLFDDTGRVVQVNRRFAEIFGAPAVDSYAGINLRDRLAEGPFKDALEKALAGRESSHTGWYTPVVGDRTVYLRLCNVRISPSLLAATFEDLTEVTLAAESLRESEERYRRIVETTGEGVWTMDAEHRTTHVNEVMARMLGYTLEEMLGRKVEEFFFPEDLEQHAAEMGRRHAGKSGRYERRFRRKDGGEVWTLVSGTPVLDADGAFSSSFGMFTDITERKRAREALQESEERYRRIVETAREGIRICDAQGRILYLNQRMADLLGFAREQILGRNIEAYIFPEDLEDHRRKMGERRQGKDDYYERKLRRSDGTAVWTLVSSKSLHDAHGQYEGALAMFSDISERKRAEEELRRSEGKFRHILEQVPLIGISLDTLGRLTFANDHFLKLTGWTREEALGTDWFGAFIPPEIRGEVRGVFAATMATKGTWDYSSHVNDILARDGRLLTVAWANVLTKDAAGYVMDVTCLGVDLTERSRAEKLLLQAKHAAEAANRAKGEFLANMSHELRTPLNGVLGMLQLLDNSACIADHDKVLLETAMESGRGLLAIINDILSFAQFDAGKLAIAREPADLREIVNSLCRAFQYEVEERGLTLEAAVDDSVPGQVLSDTGRLRQILLNLITNALKFTSGGRVEVGVCVLPISPSPADRMLLVSVSDAGIGIPDDKLDVIFEPFTQVDGSLTRKYKGTGIGLGIVRQLAHLMGGSVCVDSAVGVGTTFYVTIRCGWSLLKPAAETASQAEQAGDIAGLRVLVAEDDRVNLFTATRFLERLGCAATGAGDGREAVALLEREDFDCILMDVQMPEMDGVKATRAIRSSAALGPKARIPIIAMTAHAMPGDREQFLAAGMDGYISKPVDMDELERVLAKVALRAGER